MREARERGWDELDFILVSGDAYVDHPSFGTALIARQLENLRFRIGVIPQPDWKNVEDFTILGRPRLAFLVTAGNLDSMVNHYTAAKKRRREDSYSPGGAGGLRPDRACIVYTSMVRQAYKGVPVILGGIEASLRRLSHYDYWTDKVRRSVLLDAKADLIIYGMGEKPMTEVAEELKNGVPIREITTVRGTVWKTRSVEGVDECALLPPFEAVSAEKKTFAESFQSRMTNQDPITGKPLAEQYGDWYVVQNPPSPPLSKNEMDRIYGLPFTRKAHPAYDSHGGVPALREVSFSITSGRGCFGGCSFCSLAFHQGKHISVRSDESILSEAKLFTKDPAFKGNIHDVGGPTANFHCSPCGKSDTKGICSHKQCLAPVPCPSLRPDHTAYGELLKKLRGLPGIKRVFIRSGIRYDYLLADIQRDGGSGDRFFRDLVRYHVSGQLKVAPEHASKKVLDAMGKPGIHVFQEFAEKFSQLNRDSGKKQYIIPYFISAHPGSGLDEAVELALFLKDFGFIPDQVQEFYPTPGTISTCMYHTGLDPRTMEPIYVPRGTEERAMQKALLHFHKPENRRLVKKALLKAGREDLIGRNGLIR